MKNESGMESLGLKKIIKLPKVNPAEKRTH